MDFMEDSMLELLWPHLRHLSSTAAMAHSSVRQQCILLLMQMDDSSKSRELQTAALGRTQKPSQSASEQEEAWIEGCSAEGFSSQGHKVALEENCIFYGGWATCILVDSEREAVLQKVWAEQQVKTSSSGQLAPPRCLFASSAELCFQCV